MRLCIVSLCALAGFFVGSVQAQYSRDVVMGTDATLLCSWHSLGDENLIKSVKWYKKGKRLRSNPRYEYKEEGLNYTLTIKNVEKKDKGTYQCTPKTTVDMYIVEATFTVRVVKATLPNRPTASELILAEGQNGQVNCHYALAKEAYGLELTWTLNQENLLDDGRVSEDSETTYTSHTDDEGRDFLTITNADTAAAGQYECNYHYPDGQVFTMSFNITVNEREARPDRQTDVTFKEDFGTGVLICDVSSLQDMQSFYWEVNGSRIQEDGEKYQTTETGFQRRLTVRGVNKNDQGVYRCVAEMQYTPIAVRFNVTVVASRKHLDFSQWTPFSICDLEGNKYRFRTCTMDACIRTYGYVYEVGKEACGDDIVVQDEM